MQDMENVKQNKRMAVLSYFGILVLLPVLAAPHSKFARFHANQGLILLIVTVVYTIITMLISNLLGAVSVTLSAVSIMVFNLGNLALFVLMLIGIRNAYKGEFKEIPYIGRYRLLTQDND